MSYKKKLFQLDITSLHNLHNQLNNNTNSNNNSKKLEAILSYTPSNQDTFIVNEFKTQLQEYLWNNEMDMNPQIFANKGILLNDIPMTIVDPQNKLRYINISHVNDLLSTSFKKNKNNKNTNTNANNNNNKQNGGTKNNSSSSTSFSLSGLNNSSSSYSKSLSNSTSNSNSLSKPFSKKEFKNNNLFKNENENKINNNNLLQKENQNGNVNILKKKIENANKEFGLKNIKNINASKIKYAVNNNNNNLQQFLNEIPSKNNTKKISLEENINKVIQTNFNKKIHFTVKNYQSPTKFCSGNSDCKMNKTELCKAISDHFIVRGNIIASILSTLPRKTANGFEGGYCYQRFLNLDKCQLCLPHNYNELMSMDTKSRIQTMMLFINYMTEKECNENKGLFRKLSIAEKKSLILHGREGNDFNLLYTEYTNNVRVKYIEHLNYLKRENHLPFYSLRQQRSEIDNK